MYLIVLSVSQLNKDSRKILNNILTWEKMILWQKLSQLLYKKFNNTGCCVPETTGTFLEHFHEFYNEMQNNDLY